MSKSEKTKIRSPMLTRRRLVIGGGLIGGVLVVGLNIGPLARAALSIGAKALDPSAFGPFIKIDTDGGVTVVDPHSEMGQGTHAGIAAMVAEELDADWDQVRVETAPANIAVYGTTNGIQATVGSFAVMTSWNPLRQAGAAARAMFVGAAAAKWNVSANSIRVENGVVMHPASNRRAEFGELLTDAAKIAPPSKPVLKKPEEYKLIGTDRVRRKDSLAKSTGQTRYTQDVQLPNMLVAMVAHSPRFGGKVASFDATAAKKIGGVVDAFEIPSGVAVVAADTWSARRGRDALKVAWNDDKAEKRSSSQLAAYFHDIAAGKSDVSGGAFQTAGDASHAFDGELFEASFDFPYLAHATMEPMNCVAAVDGRRVKLTFASQIQTLDQVFSAMADITLPGMVEIETLPAGGSFGRRGVLTADYAAECVRIARKVGGGRPVKLVWTREDDMTGGLYRPMARHHLWIKCDQEGLPVAWRHHIVAQSLVGGVSVTTEGVRGSPYLSVAKIVDGKVFTPKFNVPVSYWRSVSHSHNAMALEHTIDQLARRAGRDPAEYRRAVFTKVGDARRLALLDLVCEKAGWGKPLETGWARGLAIHEYNHTLTAQVAEVSVRDGKPIIRRVVCAVDCGIAISPDQIAAQSEGGIIFGLSAALHGRVTLDAGLVQQTNFDTYQVLRMDEAPIVETYIMPSKNNPTGMGEANVAPIAPAVANAILALTGKATSSLPFVT